MKGVHFKTPLTYKDAEAEWTGAITVRLGGRQLFGETIGVGVHLFYWSEEMQLAFNLNYFLVFPVQHPNMVCVWTRRRWPLHFVAVQGGWAVGHDGGCRYEYLWGKKRGFNKVFLDTKRRRRQPKVNLTSFDGAGAWLNV